MFAIESGKTVTLVSTFVVDTNGPILTWLIHETLVNVILTKGPLITRPAFTRESGRIIPTCGTI